MDHLHAVLSVAAGRRLRILASHSRSPHRTPTGNRSHRDRLCVRRADGRSRDDMAIANHSRSQLEASQSRFSSNRNLRALDSKYRVAFLHPVHHRSAATDLVRAIASRCVAISALCALQHRIVARASDLSIRGGTCSEPASASDLWSLLFGLFSVGVVLCAQQYPPRHPPRFCQLDLPNSPTRESQFLPDRRAFYGSHSQRFHR